MSKNNNNLSMIDDFLNMSKGSKNPSEVLEKSKTFFKDFMGNIESMMENKDYSKLETTFKQISDKLQNELSTICEKYGVSPEEMQKLVNNPGNFKNEDWKALQDLKEEIKPTSDVKEKKVNKLKTKKNWRSV